MSRVTINVSGVRFEFDQKILEEKRYDKLAIMCNDAVKNGKPLEFVLDRPSDSFSAILSYYQTDELHMPSGVCPGYFQKELEFWGICSGALADCCVYRYHTFVDEAETRNKFQKQAQLHSTVSMPLYVPVTSGSNFQKNRRRLWKIVDNGENTIVAKIYFVLVIFMVLVSILSLAYSTEPYCRRSLTKCELLEYMESTEDKNVDVVRYELGNPDCSGTFEDDNGEKLEDSHYNMSVEIPRLTVPYAYFDIIDTTTLTFFTLDLMMRLASCPSFVSYFTTLINIVDACALVGSCIHLLIVNIEREHYYTHNWIRFINYTQIFRALRLFRVVKNLRASRVLAYSISQNLRDVALLAILLISGISIFSCLIFFIEDRETIVSIPEAWYWSLITMTTVGYGDISPKTGFGRFVASVCAVCGILLLAITLPMFVNSFLTLYQYSCIGDLIDKKKQLEHKLKGVVAAVTVVNIQSAHDEETTEMKDKGTGADTDICKW